MNKRCSCTESLLCNCAAQIIMANLDVTNDRQTPTHNAGTSPLDIPPVSVSPSHSPKSSPRPLSKKDTPRSERSSGSEVSPSSAEKQDSESQANVSRLSESTAALPELVRSTSQVSQTSGEGREGSKERKESRSSERTKKKQSWYHALTPSYKSRSEEFKRYFKDVPQDERLIVDYSCAVQKDLLIQGRLYVTQNYLCFYAKHFRWETCFYISWKDVTSVTKEKTALIIPNAIMISTESEKLFFATFSQRDKAYLTLFRVWQNALMDKPLSIKETWQWVHDAYGEELGLSSDDEYYEHTAAGFLEDKAMSIPFGSSTNVRQSPELDDAQIRNLGSGTGDIACTLLDSLNPMKTATPQPPAGMAEKAPMPEEIAVIDAAATDSSDTSESDVDRNLCEEASRCPIPHEGRCYVNMVLPIHIDQLFTLLFTNSKFFLEFHALRRTTDIKVTSWQPNPETGEKVRTVTMTIAISASIGPRTSNVTETQVMKACSKPGHLYVIDGDVVNSGIPYADSFYVDTHYCLVKSGDQETTLSIYAQLKYKKTVWQIVKGVIEKSTWSGLDDFYESLAKSLQLECDETSAKGRPHRRRSRGLAKPVLLPVEEIVAAQSRTASIHKKVKGVESDGNSYFLVTCVLIVLFFLLLLNTLLYYKLWLLEEWTRSPRTNLSQLDLEVLKNPPKTHDEWLELFRHQESLHRAELARWQSVLQSAVRLLRRAEEELNGLQGVGESSPPDEL